MTSPVLRRIALTGLALATVHASPARAGGLVNPFVALPWAPNGIQFAGQFGFTVAPAGDINRDGFSDVLVGAFGEDNTQSNEGRTHVFLGSAQGLALVPTRIHVTGQEDAAGGLSVAPAGDVNGDGFADFLIGVPYWNTQANADAGKVLVYHGAANLPFGPSDSLFSPAPAASQLFGRTVAPAGDVNGDGYDDVVVGTPNYMVGAFFAGAAWVFHGGPSGLAEVPARTWIGPPENGEFGRSVSTAGDVNGDGFADVIVGAPGRSVGFALNGAAHLYLGSAAGIAAAPDTVIVGTAATEICGSSVANAGDVNGDGYADVLIGSPGFNGNVGRCRLVRGGPSGLETGTILPNTENLPGEAIGLFVATMGDLDGDGFADVGVRASYTSGGNRGRITVHRGGRNGTTILGDLLAPTGSGTFANSIATAGDTNGDGLSEILVGTEDWSTAPGWSEGKVFLYAAPRSLPLLDADWPLAGPQPGTGYGTSVAMLVKTAGSIFPQFAIGDPGHGGGFGRITFHNGGIFSGFGSALSPGTIVGTENFQSLGARLADVGDVNRDGYSDMISSSPTLDNGATSQAGRVDLHPGSIDGLIAAATVLVGDREFDRVGTALAGRGDVNGDGYHDFVVGAREWDSASLENCGKAWLYLGSSTGPAPGPWTREGSTAGAGLGTSVALTDFDGDGYSDVIVGTSAVLNGIEPDHGMVEVFYGSPGGAATSPGLVLGGINPDISYGSTVAAIGDVTGDQIADLAIGAPTLGGVGRVYIHAGTLGRSQSRTPIQTYAGLQADARFGAAIAGGGDVDGDGRGDFVIGSPGFDAPAFFDCGRIDLYLGARGIPPATPQFSVSHGIVGARFGESISPLADGNLDGFADIVVGAPGAAGRVYPYLGGAGPGHFATVTLYEPNIAFKRRVHPARLDDPDEVETELLFASPGGRSLIGVEFEVAPQNLPFTGVPTQTTGLVYDSGEPDDGAGLLSSVIHVSPLINLPWPGSGYHVRTRFVTRSPFFPRSRWLLPEAHTSGDLDVRTSGALVEVTPPEGLRPGLHGVAPNPSAAGGLARLSFALAGPGRAVLELYDVRGALVRRLLDESRPAGPSSVAWDGRDDHGRAVPAGLYFARFVGDGQSASVRVVRLP